jgi:uncharacterized protein (DUF1697 family)
MRTHVALLRGINVGGHNKVAMADLREIVAALGHSDVATYIQSGNVVFSSEQTDTARIAADLEQEIDSRLGVRPGVVVLSREELAGVIADNPWPEERVPKCLHAVFRRQAMTGEEITAVAAAQERAGRKGSRDEAAVVGRTLFLHTPDGLGRSELAIELGKAGGAMSPKAGGTARNWATVMKLMGLLDG